MTFVLGQKSILELEQEIERFEFNFSDSLYFDVLVECLREKQIRIPRKEIPSQSMKDIIFMTFMHVFIVGLCTFIAMKYF